MTGWTANRSPGRLPGRQGRIAAAAVMLIHLVMSMTLNAGMFTSMNTGMTTSMVMPANMGTGIAAVTAIARVMSMPAPSP